LPEYRKQGIGREFIEFAETYAKEKGITQLASDCFIDNEMSEQFHKSCGFTEKERVICFVKDVKPEVIIRELTEADYPILADFLYHAIFVPPGEEPPPRDIINNPDVFIYIKDFDSQEGDCGMVAVQDGKIVGAAWTRIIPAYGHIDEKTPELATSVLPEYRGRGIGTKLMERLVELLRERGYRRTSLAVQQKNAAVRFYHRLGYVTIRENEEEFIMIKELTEGTDYATGFQEN
jgi:GNAT superfamily N-acetyltransferase